MGSALPESKKRPPKMRGGRYKTTARCGTVQSGLNEGSHFRGVNVWLDFPNIERRL